MSSVRVQALAWYWQRISAMVLALCVAVHIGLIIYAVHGGLTAAEILGRTRGNWAFGLFYVVFVLACAVHAPIGLANVLAESPLGRSKLPKIAAHVFGLVILVLGLRAVWAVIA